MATEQGRKKLNAEDVLAAIKELDLPFEDDLQQTLEGASVSLCVHLCVCCVYVCASVSMCVCLDLQGSQ